MHASKKNSTTTLHWATATELNNSHFNVQRSSDSKQWQTIGTVQGGGTTLVGQEYGFTDRQPLAGMNYYRLEQVDFDGTAAVSQVVSVHFKNEDSGGLTLSPNPVRKELMLRLDGHRPEGLSYQIYDLRGQLWQGAAWQDSGVSVADLPAGLYLLRLLDGQGAVLGQQRFVKN